MTDILVDLLAEDGTDFDSSSIDFVGYDRGAKRLYVEFQSSGTVYSYEGVEESTYNLFVGADSLNAFWRDHIKGNYTSGPQSDGCLVLDEDPIQPEQKWLSTDGDESPFAAAETEFLLLLCDGATLLPTTPSAPVITPSKYGVKWTNGTLTFEPLFEAMSEADALAQFNAAVGQVMPDADVKIQAVTHYFD